MIDQPDLPNAREIFLAALRIECQDERLSFVEQACGSKIELRARVIKLLDASADDNRSPLASLVVDRETGDPGVRLDETAEGMGTSTGDFTVAQHPGVDFDLPANRWIGAYKLLEKLGSGGMGTVYLAQQTKPVKRLVAIKVINPGMNSREVIARFEAERQALAMMDHPNIARVFDGGTTQTGVPYFVMEVVRGVPLTEFCSAQSLRLEQRLRVFITVCHAVQHAHHKGIIHRDLKPSNILVTMHDHLPVPKVIDFGVAKALNQDLTEKTLVTRFAQLIGTPLYMAPEQSQMSGLDADTRSDIYSLGAILYELVTGATPFDLGDLAKRGVNDLREVLLNEEPPRPSARISTLRGGIGSTIDDKRKITVETIAKDLNRELDWIVMKALEKDRDRRYESAKEFADDLQRYLNSEPVLACPPSARYRFRKWLMRNRFRVAAGCMAIAMLLFITVLSLWQVHQVNQAWAESLTRERQATDLLEAIQTQSAFDTLRQSSYEVSATLVDSPVAGGPTGSPEDRRPYFHRLFLDVIRPPHEWEIRYPGEVNDLVWNHANNRAWILRSSGMIDSFDPLTRTTSEVGNIMDGQAGVAQTAISIGVSPSGTVGVVGTDKGQLRFFDPTKPISPSVPIDIGQAGVETLSWSSDGKYVAAGTRYEGVWVGTSDGKKLFQVTNDHRHESLLFHPGNHQLFIPTRKGIDVFSLPDGKRLRSISTGTYSNPRELLLAGPNREWLLAFDRFAETALVLDVKTGKRLGSVPFGANYPQSLVVLTNGRWIAAVFPDGIVRIVSLSQGREDRVTFAPVAVFPVADHGVPIEENTRLRLQASLDGEKLLTAGPDGCVRLWNLSQILPTQVFSPPSPLNAAYPVAHDELTYFFQAGHLRKRELCDVAIPFGIGKKAERPMGEQIPIPIHCFSKSISSNGRIACAGYGGVVVYDIRTGKLIRTWTASIDLVRHVAISLDGRAVAVSQAGDDGVLAWRTSDDWKTVEPLLDSAMTVEGVLKFSVGKEPFLFWDESSKRIHQLGLESGQRKVLTETPNGKFIIAANSSDGRMIAVGEEAGLRVINTDSGAEEFGVDKLSSVTALQFTPSGRVLLSGHENGQIRGWHLPTRQPLGVLFEPKQVIGLPEAILLFPDCHRLLINFRRDGKVTPVVVGTGRVANLRPGGESEKN